MLVNYQRYLLMYFQKPNNFQNYFANKKNPAESLPFLTEIFAGGRSLEFNITLSLIRQIL